MQCQLKNSSDGLRQIYLPVTRKRSLDGASQKEAGFTLVEVVMAVAIVALVFAGILNAYIQSGIRLEWTGYSLAAQSLAIETIEQARSSVWDPAETPPVNEITNLSLLSMAYNATNQAWTGYSTNILDVPYESSNYIVATNFVSIQMRNVSTYSNVQIEVLQVQTVWPFRMRGSGVFFTNTISTIISPDNRAPSTF